MISLLASAKATLRVIGLATVMQGNPGIDIVMPAVPEATHIEAHVAVLIVRNQELVSPTTGWKARPFGNEFTWVDLTGEDVQFLPDAANGPAAVPPNLPRLTNGCQWDLTSLPKGVFSTDVLQPPLLAGYRPPLYVSAAARLRVPYGSTSICQAFVKDKDPKNPRIDTTVQWRAGATSGGVTIVGKQHETRLRLQGKSILIVAGNVPRSVMEGKETMSDLGHFKAYYTMLDPNGRNGCFHPTPAARIRRCPESAIPSGPAPPPPVPRLIFIVTSECSNSQYP